MGFYAGWSATPVVGGLITASIGLVTAGVFYVRVHRATGTPGNQTQPSALSIDEKDITRAACSLILFCMASIVGTFIGIKVRTGNFVPERSSELDSLSTKYAELPQPILSRLVILQNNLELKGYDRKQSNAFFSKYAASLTEKLEKEMTPPEGHTFAIFPSWQSVESAETRELNSLIAATSSGSASPKPNNAAILSTVVPMMLERLDKLQIEKENLGDSDRFNPRERE